MEVTSAITENIGIGLVMGLGLLGPGIGIGLLGAAAMKGSIRIRQNTRRIKK